MNSDGLLTRIALESLRAAARAPASARPQPPRDAAARLELLNQILLRDEDVAARHPRRRARPARNEMRL